MLIVLLEKLWRSSEQIISLFDGEVTFFVAEALSFGQKMGL